MSVKTSLTTVPSTFSSAINGNIEMINQLQDSLSALNEAQFCWQHHPISGSVGTHTRHIVDHYTCFFVGVQRNEINYDLRARDVQLETCIVRANEVLEQVTRVLNDLTELDAAASILVVSSTDAQIEPLTTASTLVRELVFLQSHTIHHMALIRIIFELQGCDVPEFFGFSPSTLKQEQRYG